MLFPQLAKLRSTTVLAQAWKKSHTFIRRHNWYSDTLELDSSVMDLQSLLADWSLALQRPDFSPEALRLVPAPKNGVWEFHAPPTPFSIEWIPSTPGTSPGEPSFGDWRSRREEIAAAPMPPETSSKKWKAIPKINQAPSTQKLRPLAHLTIRDQSLASAVMMCLAEVVESVQGDTTLAVSEARAAGVVSYGNRLQCQWVKLGDGGHVARFSWGSSKTYRKFFEDYRTFLSRPRKICSQLSASSPKGEELFVASLDISAFFDGIDTAALQKELRRLEEAHREKYGIADDAKADEEFWQATQRIFSWKWNANDHQFAPQITGESELQLGLPQGLVASGFLANAYLVRLDKALVAAFQNKETHHDFRVLDYCRYVDDIRLVIEAPSRFNHGDMDTLRKQVMDYFTLKLAQHQKDTESAAALTLSHKKCSVVPYRSISVKSNLSATMEALQAELSGTFDLESLVQADGGLETLLKLSEQMETEAIAPHSRLALANVALPEVDVRDDTLKRFVASRLSKSLRARLSMSESADEEVGSVDQQKPNPEARAIAHDFESTARKLIKCWATNPSLVVLLRYALDLFPHPRLLSPVLEALEVKIFGLVSSTELDDLKEMKVAEYCLADLFNAAASHTGYRPLTQYPAGVDIVGYREQLSSFAQRILLERLNSPWYLQQQASLFLAAMGMYTFAPSNAVPLPEMMKHLRLHLMMLYQPVDSNTVMFSLPLALVAQQLAPNPQRFGEWFSAAMKALSSETQQASVKLVARVRPDLLKFAANTRVGKVSSWRKLVPDAVLLPTKNLVRKEGLEDAVFSLHQLMSQPQNVFGQENAILTLAKALLETTDIKKHLDDGVSATEIYLKCDDLRLLNSLPPAGVLRVSNVTPAVVPNELYETPPWVIPEKRWLYALGRILRSALTGDFDFTVGTQLLTDDSGKYRGVRSTSFNRRFSMLNNCAGLLEEPSPITPWLSGLFSALLQWPGMYAGKNNAAPAGNAKTVAELLAFFEARITEQKRIYGSRSRTPIYVIPTSPDAPLEERPMRVAIVQPMLPRREEFNVKDPSRWSANDMARHEQHLAQVCRLTNQKIRSWESAKKTKLATHSPAVDLILFPELSVHPEHVSYLDSLSDATGASIFAGLTFMRSAKLKGTINQGLWVLRRESAGGGRTIEYIWQGKQHPIKQETAMGVKGYRPHITLVEFPIGSKTPTRVAAAICYDSTDLDLIADLREQSDMFLVSALNQDVTTFDNMVAALNFHMYQPVILANSGEFGGSTAQLPLPRHEKLLAHVHGGNQVAVSVFEVDPSLFKTTVPVAKPAELKTAPAGYTGRPRRISP